MQTFLPYPSFVASAAALDDRRLGKQRVETFQILRALVFPSYGWKNHPAVAMWRGFTPALVGYGLAVCAEWERRGHPDAVAASLLAFSGGVAPDLAGLRLEGKLPPWLGDPAVHTSHRASLLRKDPEQYAGLVDTDPELPYVWPRPLFPRWPVRRVGALTIDAAYAVIKLTGRPAELPEAVAAVAAGEIVRFADPAFAMAVLLCLPPPALWLTAGFDVRADEPPPSLAVPPEVPAGPEARAGRRTRRLSASIARPPGPDDEAAMAAETVADVGVVVHPASRLDDPAVRRRLGSRRIRVIAAERGDGWEISAAGAGRW